MYPAGKSTKIPKLNLTKIPENEVRENELAVKSGEPRDINYGVELMKELNALKAKNSQQDTIAKNTGGAPDVTKNL